MLKNKIQADFIIAMKSKDEVGKSALSSIKAKITEAEKLNNTELSDDDIVKLINKAVKQREESGEIFQKAGRLEMAQKEFEESIVLKTYLPASLTEEELYTHAISIWAEVGGDNLTKRVGMTKGLFNKRFPGQFNSEDLQAILKEFTI